MECFASPEGCRYVSLLMTDSLMNTKLIFQRAELESGEAITELANVGNETL